MQSKWELFNQAVKIQECELFYCLLAAKPRTLQFDCQNHKRLAFFWECIQDSPCLLLENRECKSFEKTSTQTIEGEVGQYCFRRRLHFGSRVRTSTKRICICFLQYI